MKVTMLCGGIGGSRLAVPLAAALEPGALSLIVNTGDDHWRFGLRICPDLDTNLYALGNLSDKERGWGLVGDTFGCMEQVARLGGETWFSLGDRDLATHLRRTGLLAEGQPLSAVTAELAQRLGIATALLPATDDEMATRIVTSAGEQDFEEWFVRDAANDEVVEVRYKGDAAAPAPGVLSAIAEADLVIIGPSNPISSIGPILAVAGIREAVAGADRAVAVTPIVRGVALGNEGEERRARSRTLMMASKGLHHRAGALAEIYRDLVDTIVIDETDESEGGAIQAAGMAAVAAPTILTDAGSGAALVNAVLGAARKEPRG